MSFKTFNQAQDVSVNKSVVNEVIPLTGAFFSGSPSSYVKNYINITSGSYMSGGFFQTIYDGSPTSISSSALVDLSYGFSSASLLAGYTATFLPNEKQRTYKEMARLLLGSDNQVFTFNNKPYNECFFMLFKRRIFKDSIKKGSFTLSLQLQNDTLVLSDAGAAGAFQTTPGGNAGLLYSASTPVGSVYYDSGIVVFATGAFIGTAATGSIYWSGSTSGTLGLNTILSGNIDNAVDGFRNRIIQTSFQNETVLHSTYYFCRATNAEFNYSTNPTFVDSTGRIVPTSGTNAQTRTYFTGIGLFDVNLNLLAVGKLSAPIRKSPDSEVTIRLRLSY